MEDAEIAAELTTLNFILSNLFAFTLARCDVKAAEVDGLSDEMQRQLEMPAAHFGSRKVDPEAVAAMLELVSNRTAMFMATVKGRLAQYES